MKRLKYAKGKNTGKMAVAMLFCTECTECTACTLVLVLHLVSSQAESRRGLYRVSQLETLQDLFAPETNTTTVARRSHLHGAILLILCNLISFLWTMVESELTRLAAIKSGCGRRVTASQTI
jgi:hypothetical protein